MKLPTKVLHIKLFGMKKRISAERKEREIEERERES